MKGWVVHHLCYFTQPSMATGQTSTHTLVLKVQACDSYMLRIIQSLEQALDLHDTHTHLLWHARASKGEAHAFTKILL